MLESWAEFRGASPLTPGAENQECFRKITVPLGGKMNSIPQPYRRQERKAPGAQQLLRLQIGRAHV